MTAPARVIEVGGLDDAPESDGEGAASGVLKRAKPQLPDYEGAGVSESAMAEAMTLAARAGRWDAVAQLTASRRFRP